MTARLPAEKPLAIAVVAMGGQGGGVLTDWIVALAETAGWHAQSTSVPGVAQRTGATLYYIEMLPARADGRAPVLALMPSPGDVDVVLAAEYMEAGRSMLRGLVTPEKTTLIASTHRALAVSEKEVPGDGVASSGMVTEAMGVAAKRTIAFDMQTLAATAGSVISAPLFGALAASAALPFTRKAFEAVIQAGGRGIEPSLAAFTAGYEATLRPAPSAHAMAPPAKRFEPLPETSGHPDLDRLLTRIRSEFPAPAHAMLFAGTRRLVDYQDPAYANDYLDRVAGLHHHDDAMRAWRLTITAAKYTAMAMAYDDVIAVADRKTRASRFARVRRDSGVADGQVAATTEFMHPRGREVVGMLPARLGAWFEAHPRVNAGLDRLVNRRRLVTTTSITWFTILAAIAGLRRWRPRNRRHAGEMAHIADWLALAGRQAQRNYPLAVEILAARRLVKGYSDTHDRGAAKFDRVLATLPLLENRADGGDWLRRLVTIALQDESASGLDGAIRTIQEMVRIG